MTTVFLSKIKRRISQDKDGIDQSILKFIENPLTKAMLCTACIFDTKHSTHKSVIKEQHSITKLAF